MRAWAVLLALAGGAVGCSTPRAQLKVELGARASEELKCPEDQVQFTELDRVISTTKVKASGCGREIVYQLEESRWHKAR